MTKYSFQGRIWVKKKGQFLISEGRVELLKLIEKHGSLKQAAEELGMSYRHAWGILKKINENMGEEVIESVRGGASGGETILTEAGKEIIEEYEERARAMDIIMRFGPRPSVAVDGIIIRNNKILLIQRRNNPFKGRYAIPGGFVEFKEPVEDAVVREIEEETGLKTAVKKLFGVYSTPDRDPRGHTISVVFELDISGGKTNAGSDAASLKWFKLDKLPELAFDHLDIISDYRNSKNK
jgi:8-oxo-dGTP diphosphatase